MRRILAASFVVGLILAFVAATPVTAATRTDVTMTVTTIFENDPDAFTATGLPGCATGFVSDGRGHVQFTPGPGVFAGFKVFDCGSDSGFVLRVNARFGPDGSEGTWSVVASWGSVAGMHGSGSLTGDPIDGGILDQYTGTVVL